MPTVYKYEYTTIIPPHSNGFNSKNKFDRKVISSLIFFHFVRAFNGAFTSQFKLYNKVFGA